MLFRTATRAVAREVATCGKITSVPTSGSLRLCPQAYFRRVPGLFPAPSVPIQRKSLLDAGNSAGRLGLTAQVLPWFPDRLILPTVLHGIRNDGLKCPFK